MPSDPIQTTPPNSSTNSEPSNEPPELTNQSPETDTPEVADTILCAVCQTRNPANALACSNCGSLLVTDGATRRFEGIVQEPGPRERFMGKVIGDAEAIALVFDSDQLTVKIPESVTIGRINAGNDDVPDVDLTPYGAADQGVSRKHIKIIRKDVLFFVVDLGSTNGTDLNGKRLLPHTERMLRSDDELRLGRFKVKVKL
jgi:hypothetical protein